MPRLVRYCFFFVFLTVSHFDNIDIEIFKFFGIVTHFGQFLDGNIKKFETVSQIDNIDIDNWTCLIGTMYPLVSQNI